MKQVLLLHGFLGAPESWDAVVQACGSAPLIVAPALVGHGDEAQAVPPDAVLGPLGQLSFSDEVARLVNQARATGFTGGTVCGYSLGGRLALGLALAAPELVTQLVVISAHPGLAEPLERAQRAQDDDALAAQIERDGLAAFVRDWERQALFRTQSELPEPVLAAQRRIRLGHAPWRVAGALRQLSLGRMPDFGPRLHELAMPVRWVAGAEDAKFRALALRMHGAVAHSTIEVIPGCGHNPLLESPRRVAQLIQTVL